MKRVMVALASLAMVLAFSACEGSSSSTGSSEEVSENKGSASQDGGAATDNSGKTSTSSKGSFPVNGDSDFYCVVSKGEGWVQLKVNIPNYMGHIEKVGYDSLTDTGTQYYEESYYGLKAYEKKEMCLEYDRDIKNDKDRDLTDYYCGDGVFYMLNTVKNASLYMEEYTMAEDDFEEDCKRYEREWEDGDYDEIIERRM
jgi:hypothetical protein